MSRAGAAEGASRALERAAEAYFRSCEGEPLLGEEGSPVVDRQGLPVLINAHPPTMSGLALALGFDSRESLLAFREEGPMGQAVARARLRVEEYCEGRLYDKDGRQGAEFALRHNFRWKEEGETGDREETGVVLLPGLQGEGRGADG